MPMEEALLARAQPFMFAAKAKAIVLEEAGKGCQPLIAAQPVALEPPYRSIRRLWDRSEIEAEPVWVIESPIPEEELVRLQIWVSPDQECDWNRSELLLKHLTHAHHRMALETVGNEEQITIQLLCHLADLPIVRTAVLGQFEHCELSIVTVDPFRGVSSSSWAQMLLCDFYPSPPYSHLFTQPSELRRSPLATVITALSSIPSDSLGIQQMLV